MNEHRDAILKALQAEFDYRQDQYKQWILAAGLKEGGKNRYTARVVLITSDSPLLDGMDIEVTVTPVGAVLDPDFYLDTPELQGSLVRDALNWVQQLAPIVYLQLACPLARREAK